MASKNWDPHKVFDISPEERAVVEERARMRVELKAEWQKKLTNPNKPTTGFIFDPAIQRYFSTRSGGYQYFKPTPYTAAVTFSLVIGPMILFSVWAQRSKNKEEATYRSGTVAYKDRWNKFLN
ncbi:NADH dehydrogenase [ubiquinone] 1 beta subcomplex subunit 4-like [Lineus longissimus]|uniref:NADH dehydrogenase [ubiquinone] 1 beta subcomplex subunit 4-like n=1 Tax=Lineus longissimus TaxID=88925 RepID=UPI002B4E2B6A